MTTLHFEPDAPFQLVDADTLTFGKPLYVITANTLPSDADAESMYNYTVADLFAPGRAPQAEVWTPTGRMRHIPSNTLLASPDARIDAGFESGTVFAMETGEKGWEGPLSSVDLNGFLALGTAIDNVHVHNGNEIATGRLLFTPYHIDDVEELQRALPNTAQIFWTRPLAYSSAPAAGGRARAYARARRALFL